MYACAEKKGREVILRIANKGSITGMRLLLVLVSGSQKSEC